MIRLVGSPATVTWSWLRWSRRRQPRMHFHSTFCRLLWNHFSNSPIFEVLLGVQMGAGVTAFWAVFAVRGVRKTQTNSTPSILLARKLSVTLPATLPATHRQTPVQTAALHRGGELNYERSSAKPF